MRKSIVRVPPPSQLRIAISPTGAWTHEHNLCCRQWLHLAHSSATRRPCERKAVCRPRHGRGRTHAT
eukprot:2884264-Pleurochrysis_carterae.AAC.1